MRILVENGGYDLQNLGDQALLQIGLERLGQLWPDAELLAFSSVPERFGELYPRARPTPENERRQWMGESVFPRALQRASPRVWESLRAREESFRARKPRLWNRLLDWRCRVVGSVAPESLRFRALVKSVDLVVALGGGYINDSFTVQGSGVLTTLAAAAGYGKPIAMLGHGLGPLTQPRQRALAKTVFPKLILLGLRESDLSLPLALGLGAPRDRIVITGDDAIEPASACRPDALGEALGVNFRVTDYSGLTAERARSLGGVFAGFAQEAGTQLVAVPITIHPRRSDMHAMRDIFPSLDADLIPNLGRLSPRDAIDRAGRCRLVATGSFHAGIFALAQGVSVIGLAASDYYRAKFDGLRKAFGAGCHVFSIDGPDAERRLAGLLKSAWDEAPRHRPALLAAAQEQIAAGRQAYTRLKASLERPSASAPGNAEGTTGTAAPPREVSHG